MVIVYLSLVGKKNGYFGSSSAYLLELSHLVYEFGVLNSDEREDAQSIEPNWQFFVCDDAEVICHHLDLVFNDELESESAT